MKHIIVNPGGRTRLPEDKKLGKPIPVRFTQKQLDRIKRKCSKAGKSFAAYVRESAVNAVVRANPSREALKEIQALNNLGTNVNTIAKTALKEGLLNTQKKADEAVTGTLEILHNTRRGIREKKEEVS